MLPLGARFRAFLVVTLLAAASFAIVGGHVNGFSSGIDEQLEAEGGGQTTLVEGGCSCHNPQYTGNVVAVLEGVPSFYSFDGEVRPGPYELTVRIAGGPNATEGRNQGGFNLQASQGTLTVPDGATDVKVMEETGEATHTIQGARQREWTVLWEPPAEPGPDAIFTLTVNAVNGNAAPDPGDEWGRATVVAMGAQRLGAAEEEHGVGVHEVTALGVSFYAYWVGVISFIVLFVVLAATFFLLRYGETRHWTDWKDRPAREAKEGAPRATGTFVALAIVLVVGIVAAMQVLRMV